MPKKETIMAPSRHKIAVSFAGSLAIVSATLLALTMSGCAWPVTPEPEESAVVQHVYGNGSAGAVTLLPGEGIFPANPQFTDFTIETGRTMNLDTGTVIRCSGNFVNNGTIVVNVGAAGGYTGDESVTGDTLTYPYQPPHPGWSIRLASNGELAINHAGAVGGVGGMGITEGRARWLLQPGIFGGGGGGNSTGGAGGYGGGAIVILVRGTFTNNGIIRADGDSGSGNAGGGGGGIIIVGSPTATVNTGTIYARGGDSRNVDTAISPAMASGGGGGGGIVHLLAPTVTHGTINVDGGQAGAVNTNVSANKHLAGGGGGACGGNGGYGGDVPAGNPTNPEQGQVGGTGKIIVDLFDPTNLFW